jgi:putative transposase
VGCSEINITSTIRYRGYDYSEPGAYYVTICTKNKSHYFGEIENGIMIFSETGEIAQRLLIDMPAHFPYIKLDEFIVMPNHIHVIIVINEMPEIQNIINQNDGFIAASSIDKNSLTGMVEPLHATALSKMFLYCVE